MFQMATLCSMEAAGGSHVNAKASKSIFWLFLGDDDDEKVDSTETSTEKPA